MRWRSKEELGAEVDVICKIGVVSDYYNLIQAVKENGDEAFTLGDLLDIYYGKKSYATYDRSALQWNKFVKDFCQDPATEVFPERLKVAAKLWKAVRESDLEKVYSNELLKRYMDTLQDP